MATSGELLYQLVKTLDTNDTFISFTNNSKESVDNDNLDLKQFLKDQSFLLNRLEDIRYQHQLIHKYYNDKIAHLQNNLFDMLKLRKEAIELDTKLLKRRIQQELIKEKEAFEGQLIQSILKYARILQDDISNAMKKLNQERNDKDAMKMQAKIHRDLLIFNFHLRIETRTKIELILLSRDSAQYQRCVKAVHDNMNNHFGMTQSYQKLTADNLRVLNVLKLKNTFLSQTLQKASNRAKNPKLKGLFCCIPSENIYDFVVHGVGKQALPDSLTMPTLLPEETIFHTPWIFANNEPLIVPATADMMELHQLRDTAKRKCREVKTLPHIRFSRYSTISTALQLSSDQQRQGIFLSLCRVLITRQKTINAYITDDLIVDAAIQGYDALYSSLSEEYVLLQPAFVLPEFLIHVYYHNLTPDTSSSSSSSSSSTTTATTTVGSNVKEKKPQLLQAMDYVTITDIEQQNQYFSSAEDVLLQNAFQTLNTRMNQQQQQSLQNRQQLLQMMNSEDDLLMDSSRSRSNSPRKKSSNSDPIQDNSNILSAQKGVMIKQSALLSIEKAVQEFKLFKGKLLYRNYRQMEEYLDNMRIQQQQSSIQPML